MMILIQKAYPSLESDEDFVHSSLSSSEDYSKQWGWLSVWQWCKIDHL